MNKIKKRLTAALAGGAIAAASLFAPQAMAAQSTEMELRILQMEETLRMMRGELEAVRSENLGGRFDALEERVGAVDMGDYKKKGGSMIYFSGGFSRYTSDRGNEAFTDSFGEWNPSLGGINNSKNGWNIGAGIEHTLSEDLLGLMDGARLMGEIRFQHTTFRRQSLADRVGPSLAGAHAFNVDIARGVEISQFTLSASPKIKLDNMQILGFTPWIIPIGLDINVISPPSNGATYIMAGSEHGIGAEMQVIKSVTLGFEGRYHYAARIDGTDPRYWQAGGYLGFKF